MSEKPRKFQALVSYSFTDKKQNIGWGRSFISCRIKSHIDVEVVEAEIKKRNEFETVSVTNFCNFDDPQPADTPTQGER